MEELAAYRAELLSALEGVLADLSQVVAQIPSGRWHLQGVEDTRTPHYILFRLCELETQVFASQLTRLITEEHPDLAVFDDDAWMADHYCTDEPPTAILEEVVRLRRRELDWLKRLSPADWSRSARHLWWGEHTLQWWIELQLETSQRHLKLLAASATP